MKPGLFVVASLLICFSAPAGAQTVSTSPVTSRLASHNGRPTIFVNDMPLSPMVYALTDVPGGRWSWEEIARHNIREFGNQGLRLFQVDLFFDHLWSEDGRLDITPARKQIAGILEVCPEAAVIFRFHVTAPQWWTRSFPDEWVRYADTDYQDEPPDGLVRIIEEDNAPVRRVSMASTLWKSEASQRLAEFLRALAATPEGNALAGIQVANGIYGEWHNWGFFRNEPDISASMNRHFRAWLRSRYGTDAALEKAWNRPGITLSTAGVPGMAERATTAGIFRDPSREQPVIDYYRCVHELVADNIIHFARIVKETWPRPILTGTFYGYYFSTFGRQAAGGHLELHRVLASPYIDYLSGPQAYEPESIKLGDAYRSRSLITSIRVHGKLWLDEMDAEPPLPIARDTRHDLLLRNSIASVRRNVLFTATKGMGLWFYDFGAAGVDLDGFRYNHRGSRGSWDHPRVLAEIRDLKKLLDNRLGREYRTGADVLFVYDTESFYHTASLRGTDPVSNVLIDQNTLTAFKSGVVFDPVHIRDLERIDLSPYRAVVFGNCYLLDEQQITFVKDSMARDGRTLVWFYAPGYTDGAHLDAGRISRVTGIRVSQADSTLSPEILLSLPGDTAVSYRTGTAAIAPLFTVVDPSVEVFGRFKDSGRPAVARKVFDNHTAWYVALPNTATEPLKYILRNSGAHVYTTQGDIVYAGGGILILHTKEGGNHSLTLRNGNTLVFTLPEGSSTLVLDSETGAHLRPPPAE